MFIQKLQMDKWIVNKCLNCDCYVYAIDGNEEMMLINAQLLRDNNNHLLLETIMNDKNFSLPFKVLLKPIQEESNISAMKSNINGDARLKGLFDKLQDFIDKDSSETEAEIRRLTAAMNQRRQQAERDFQLIVTLINSIMMMDSNNINKSTMEQSTKLAMSTDITPPVTPESAHMTIDDHHHSMIAAAQTPQKQPSQHHNHHNSREGTSKHNSALLQHKQMVTRNIDFDDDIFELDGMAATDQINSGIKNNDNDHYHKYSDTDDTSDVDEMIEKRPIRGRSGSACFARSAPISMPHFMHHASIHHDDNKLQEDINENDIPSSIKILAKSIHADSIFGELPVRRPTVKYNADF